MSADKRFRVPALRTAILAISLVVLTGIATPDGAWARTRQQCSVVYARCINRAIDTGKGVGTLVNCDTMASNCFRNASDALARKSPAGKPGTVKALEARKIPVVQGGVKRR